MTVVPERDGSLLVDVADVGDNDRAATMPEAKEFTMVSRGSAASDATMSGAVWDPPGPGTWELDTAHFAPTVSRPMRDLMSNACESGLAVGMELAGAPLKTLQTRVVNGRMYTRQVPLVGGNRDLPTPPKPILWLVTRLHPQFRKRAKRSVVALDERYWNAEFDRWEREWKPELIAANRRFASVDPSALNDAQLADHLGAVWAHVERSGELHFRLHSSDLGPIGLLLLRATEMGLDGGAVMAALAGASPATSAPTVALQELASELRDAEVTPTSLDDVRAASERASELLDGYLAEFGDRLTGYDLRDQTLAELPGVVLRSILNADPDAAPARSAQKRGEAALANVIERVPQGRRVEFTELVSDARRLYGLRDENGPLTFEWPGGVARGVVLECARRLVDRGKLEEIEHVFDASIEEMRGLLAGSDAPSRADLAERCAERMSWAELDAPTVLGPPAVMPDVDVLPGQMPDMMRAVLLVTTLIERNDHGSGVAAETTGLTGTGIGNQPHRGVARVVFDADDAFARCDPGDIIVTKFTAPTFNAVLAMSGGVVTEGGGLLCHTAVIARELGIPAVVGVPGAMSEIPDGADIEIDPIAGTVTVLST